MIKLTLRKCVLATQRVSETAGPRSEDTEGLFRDAERRHEHLNIGTWQLQRSLRDLVREVSRRYSVIAREAMGISSSIGRSWADSWLISA